MNDAFLMPAVSYINDSPFIDINTVFPVCPTTFPTVSPAPAKITPTPTPASTPSLWKSNSAHEVVQFTQPKGGWRGGLKAYKNIILDAAKKHNVSPYLIFAIIYCESYFDPRALSHAKAKGLMQLMDETATKWNVKNSFDPIQNINAGTAHIAERLGWYNGDLKKAIGAYNTSYKNINRGFYPPETKEYIVRVLEKKAKFEKLKIFG